MREEDDFFLRGWMMKRLGAGSESGEDNMPAGV